MPSSFLATHVSTEEVDGVLVTHFAAGALDSGDRYLTLQRSLENDEQDFELGLMGPYIEYCSQAWSWYGNIELFELHRDEVVVRMSPKAASQMQSDGILRVEFGLVEAEFVELKRSLARTFSDCTYFVIRE